MADYEITDVEDDDLINVVKTSTAEQIITGGFFGMMEKDSDDIVETNETEEDVETDEDVVEQIEPEVKDESIHELKQTITQLQSRVSLLETRLSSSNCMYNPTNACVIPLTTANGYNPYFNVNSANTYTVYPGYNYYYLF